MAVSKNKKLAPTTVTRLPLDAFEPNPENPNRVSPEILAIIRNNIERTGSVPPLIARTRVKGELEPPYILLDGHHRLQILRELGWTECDAQIWSCSETEGRVALASLNRLHGEDDIQARAALITELAITFDPELLASMLPEDASELEELMELGRIDLVALERAQDELEARNDQEAPRPFTVLLFATQEAVVRQAIDAAKLSAGFGRETKNADGAALEFIAAEFIASAAALPPADPETFGSERAD